MIDVHVPSADMACKMLLLIGNDSLECMQHDDGDMQPASWGKNHILSVIAALDCHSLFGA